MTNDNRLLVHQFFSKISRTSDSQLFFAMIDYFIMIIDYDLK